MQKPSVGIVGLGIMGSAIAVNLIKAGFRTFGYDLLAAPRNALKREGGVAARSAGDVARRAEILLTSLPSAEALESVAGQFAAKRRSGVVVEMSTLPIEVKVRVRNALKKRGLVMLDCPLSGTGAQARVKDLVVLGSGDRSAFSKVSPIFKGFSRAQYYLGEFGNGSKMKYVANLLVAIHNVSAAEAFALGMKAGLSPEMIYKVAGDGAGSSRMFQVRGPQMVAGRYDDVTMKVLVWQKDMKIIGEFAAKLGVPTPLFNASGAIYNAAIAQGFAQQDTGSVCAVMENMARVRRKRR